MCIGYPFMAAARYLNTAISAHKNGRFILIPLTGLITPIMDPPKGPCSAQGVGYPHLD